MAADGNPLFVEEMLAMIRDRGIDDVAVPPTIQALLAARLDQLEPAERACSSAGLSRGRYSIAVPWSHSRQKSRRCRRGCDARAQGSGSAGTGGAFGRRCLPLPSSADPRRRLRGAAKGGACDVARAVRRLAGPAWRGPDRARRDHRSSPGTGSAVPRRVGPGRLPSCASEPYPGWARPVAGPTCDTTGRRLGARCPARWPCRAIPGSASISRSIAPWSLPRLQARRAGGTRGVARRARHGQG